MLPDHIDRYQILSEFGSGGMAIVYKAFDPKRQQYVALKVMRREYVHDQQFRARFKREIEIHSNFKHEVVVPIYAYGQAESQLYLVLGFMAGGSLEDRMRSGKPMLPSEVLALLQRISPALDAAHRQGIIHRDLKPSNILFNEHGQAFISDFGIARLAEQASQLTGNKMIGSPAYMSPEQVRAEMVPNWRADLYSLGVMVYEMLSGKLPYNDIQPMRLALKHISEPVPDILADNPKLPPACREYIFTAIAKNPDERFFSAAEMTDELERIIRAERPAARAWQTFAPGQVSASPEAQAPSVPRPRPLGSAGAGDRPVSAGPAPEQVPSPRPLKPPIAIPQVPSISAQPISQSSLPAFLRPLAKYLRPPSWMRKPSVPYLTVPAPLRPILGRLGVPNTIAMPKKLPGWVLILVVILVCLVLLAALAAACYWLIFIRTAASTSTVGICFALQHWQEVVAGYLYAA